MKKLVIFTVLNSDTRKTALKDAMKGIISFSDVFKCCTMQSKNGNLTKLIAKKDDLKVVVFDSHAVSKEAAISYVKGFKEKNLDLTVVVYGGKYTLPEVECTDCWKRIKVIAA